jgi:polyphosphate glucokinase
MATLGIDIGGSGIKGALIDLENGQMVTPRQRIPTPEGADPKNVSNVLKELVDYFDYRGPIGCGFPAVIQNGIALSAANVHKDWVNTNAEKIFSEATGSPVYVINDADAAGLAEMKYGAGKDFYKGTVLMITLGTGIGAAIFTNGHLLPNVEFGHLQVRGKDAEHRASDAVRKEQQLSWKKWSKRLQEVLSYMELLVSPDVIIIGGGVSKDHEKYFPYLQTKAKLIPAQFLNQAGIVGAALYAKMRSRSEF